MKTLLKVLLIISWITLLIACKKNPEEVDPYDFTVSQGDFLNSEIVMVTGEDMATGNQMFKISNSNKISELIFNDENGDIINNKLNPASIINVSPFYIMVSFGKASITPVDSYIINRNTFSFTSITKYGIPLHFDAANGMKNEKLFIYDGTSKIYYKARVGPNTIKMVKLDLGMPGSISGNVILGDSVIVEDFDVDKNGNIIMDFITNKSVSKRYLKIYKTDGTFDNIIFPNSYRSFWTDLDSDFTYWNPNDAKFYKSTYSSSINTYSESLYKSLGFNKQFLRDLTYKIIYNNKLIWVDNDIYEWTSTSIPTLVTSIPFTSIKLVDHTQSNGKLYLIGNNSSGQETIFKISLSDYSYTTISDPGKYSFNCIETMNDGTIYASATRASDGKNIFIKFSSTGTETLLDETINKKALYMVKVNEF